MTSDNEMDSMDIFLTKHAEEIREFWLAQYPQTKEEVPKHKFSWRFRWKMRRLMHEYDKRYKVKHMPVWSKAVAMVAVIVFAFSAFSVSDTSAAKVSFFDTITSVFSDKTEIQYSSSELSPDDFVLSEPTYIPAGFEEVYRTVDDISVHIYYEDKHGEYIDYYKNLVDGMTFGYDSESARQETVSVAEDDTAIFASEKVDDRYRHILLWTDWSSQYFMVSSLGKTEMLKIAESATP